MDAVQLIEESRKTGEAAWTKWTAAVATELADRCDNWVDPTGRVVAIYTGGVTYEQNSEGPWTVVLVHDEAKVLAHFSTDDLLQELDRRDDAAAILKHFSTDEIVAELDCRDARQTLPPEDVSSKPKVSWRDVRVWWLASGEGDARECTEQERLAALNEFHESGGMYLKVLADPSEYHADDTPKSGHGETLDSAGPSSDEINWAGFSKAWKKSGGTKPVNRGGK